MNARRALTRPIRARLALAACVCGFALLSIACGGGASTTNPETFNIRSGRAETRRIKLEAGRKADIWVSSEKDSDIDLFVYDESGRKVAADEAMSKDCHVSFTPNQTQVYKVELQNRTFKEAVMKHKNIDNRVTLKWSSGKDQPRPTK